MIFRQTNHGFYSQHVKISCGFSLFQALGRAAKPQSSTGLFIVPGAVVPSWITNGNPMGIWTILNYLDFKLILFNRKHFVEFQINIFQSGSLFISSFLWKPDWNFTWSGSKLRHFYRWQWSTEIVASYGHLSGSFREWRESRCETVASALLTRPTKMVI